MYDIELRNVSKRFRKNVLFEDVNLAIPKGSVIGIVGANGTGKSVLFKIMTGLLAPDSGEVYIREEKLGEKKDFPENVGILINSPGYIGMFNGKKNLKFLADIRGIIGDKEIEDTMRKVGLDPNNKTRVRNYSLGMKQKLGIAQAIMEYQDIVILDEPFNALDFKTKKEIMKIIENLHVEGKTILITSHNFDDIKSLCNEIYLIDERTLRILDEQTRRMYELN